MDILTVTAELTGMSLFIMMTIIGVSAILIGSAMLLYSGVKKLKDKIVQKYRMRKS